VIAQAVAAGTLSTAIGLWRILLLVPVAFGDGRDLAVIGCGVPTK
jgi:hypothetical protein